MTSCLTTFKNNVIKYCETVYERNGITYLGLLNIHARILYKLKSKGFLASSVSTYDLSTLYTILSHNLIKEKRTGFIEETLNREFSMYLACTEKRAFFTSEQHKIYLWLCQKICDALHYLLDNIFISFCSNLYRQIVGIPMGTNFASLVSDLFFFYYVRDFYEMMH